MKIENKKAYIPCEIAENEINNGLDIRVRIDKTHDLYINRKLLIPDIDQPKLEVPQFVAEWIEKYKEKGCRLSHALKHVFDDVELGLYIKQQEGDYTEIIAKAWLYGYTVEKEKLYNVSVLGCTLFKMTSDDLVKYKLIGENETLSEPVLSLYKFEANLTEKEIKQADERLWQFAKSAF